MRPELLEHLIGVLVGDEAEVELGRRLRRENRLRARALVAGHDPGDVAGGQEKHLLDHLVRLWFPDKLLEADELASFLDLRIDGRHHAAVGLGRLDHLVVKAIDLDVHVLVAQARKRSHQVHSRRWIDGRETRMLVVVQLLDAQGDVNEASASKLESGSAGVVERRA